MKNNLIVLIIVSIYINFNLAYEELYIPMCPSNENCGGQACLDGQKCCVASSGVRLTLAQIQSSRRTCVNEDGSLSSYSTRNVQKCIPEESLCSPGR